MTKLCPSCRCPLNLESVEDEPVHRCPECRGIWFGDGELGNAVRRMNAASVTPSEAKPGIAGQACPQCSAAMVPFNYAHDSGVIVNKCASCSSVWLEDGQLERIALYRHGTPAVQALAGTQAELLRAANRWERVRGLLRSRVLSGVLAGGYVVVAIVATGNAEFVVRLFLALLFPLLCIWFSDTMGNLTGVSLGLGRPVITQTTPADLVALMGWLLLLSPILAVLIIRWGTAP